jgi:CheY-like chemotaxis protein
VDLPDGNGCELLHRLRAFLGGRPLPAIAVTGHGDKRDECARAGYAQFLHKPLEVQDVLEAIGAACPSRCTSLPVPAPAPKTAR